MANQNGTQHIYKVKVCDVITAINEAAEIYSGLQFGGVTPEHAVKKIIGIPCEDSVLHVSKVCHVLSEMETPKMLGGANNGLNNVKRAISVKRF